jgi:hypothetical protein
MGASVIAEADPPHVGLGELLRAFAMVGGLVLASTWSVLLDNVGGRLG